MSLKRVLISMGLIVLTVVLVFSGYLAKKKWAFNGKIVGDVCLSQEFMTSNYSLVTCSNNESIVADVSGWIIEGEFIYGTFGANKYFGLKLDGELVSTFDSLHEINNYLKGKSLQYYDMDREENVYHLRYGGGRNRKY